MWSRTVEHRSLISSIYSKHKFFHYWCQPMCEDGRRAHLFREGVRGLGDAELLSPQRSCARPGSCENWLLLFFFSIKLILATINPDTRQIYKTDFLSQNLCTHITLSAYSHDYSFHKNEKWFCIDWLLIVRFPAYFM